VSDPLIWLLSFLAGALLMEPWAALLHNHAWHGPLMFLHRSHHQPSGRWEWNDLLSSAHAPIAIALILHGSLGAPSVWREIGFGFGLGMTFFGFSYLVVHDGLVHGRLPVKFLERWAYFRRVKNAHKVHHRDGGVPFGLFLGPWALKRQAAKRRAAQSGGSSRHEPVVSRASSAR
jgi:beta-carotene 3-hydroxylase